jgi:RNA polymerase sigma-70 factor (ECF subfamily)
MTASSDSSAVSRSLDFATTQWSLVLSAGRRDGRRSAAALATLCESYWFALYAFVRRSGYLRQDAEELTQEFFVRLLEKNYLAAADKSRGRFRSFLLTALKHFLANEWQRGRAEKRGGARLAIPLDFAAAEQRYAVEPADPWTPEQLYQRRWAMMLLERVLEQLRGEAIAGGQSERFETLKDLLAGPAADVSYQQIATRLSTTESAIKMAVQRLRRRYRELLKTAVAQTIATTEDVDDELRALLGALSARR